MVFLFSRTDDRITPVKVHPLTPMKIKKCLGEDVECAWVVQLSQSLLLEEICVVRGIDGLGDTKNFMGNRMAATEPRRILDIINAARRISRVCSIDRLRQTVEMLCEACQLYP